MFSEYLNTHGYASMCLKTVMFDMDGVLFDSMPYHAKSWNHAMADFGLDLPVDEAFTHEGRTGSSTIEIVMRRQWGRSPSEDECKEIYARKSMYFNEFPEATRMPGAYECASEVRRMGLTPIIVTGSGQVSLLDRIERNFKGLFKSEWMVCARDVKYGKPHPEPYLMGLRKAGDLQPFNSMVIENAPLGVEAGHRAGCFVIAVNTGPLSDRILLDAGADILFHSMTELSHSLAGIITSSGTSYRS
ncbi:MAG: HAD hydrolase-like protein [Bacteroidaceae bacterium]|nr:HAD hydrolase-like protein [Bacteroidaceae bacterium]